MAAKRTIAGQIVALRLDNHLLADRATQSLVGLYGIPDGDGASPLLDVAEQPVLAPHDDRPERSFAGLMSSQMRYGAHRGQNVHKAPVGRT